MRTCTFLRITSLANSLYDLVVFFSPRMTRHAKRRRDLIGRAEAHSPGAWQHVLLKLIELSVGNSLPVDYLLFRKKINENKKHHTLCTSRIKLP